MFFVDDGKARYSVDPRPQRHWTFPGDAQMVGPPEYSLRVQEERVPDAELPRRDDLSEAIGKRL